MLNFSGAGQGAAGLASIAPSAGRFTASQPVHSIQPVQSGLGAVPQGMTRFQQVQQAAVYDPERWGQGDVRQANSLELSQLARMDGAQTNRPIMIDFARNEEDPSQKSKWFYKDDPMSMNVLPYQFMQGYSDGGQVGLGSDIENPLLDSVILALDAQSEMDPQDRNDVIEAFIDQYGEEELAKLAQEVGSLGAQGMSPEEESQGLVSDGTSDSIPANIDGKEEVRLSEGEFIIPADVVSSLGNGSTEAGARHLMQMVEEIRKAKTGSPEQPPEIFGDASQFNPQPIAQGLAQYEF